MTRKSLDKQYGLARGLILGIALLAVVVVAEFLPNSPIKEEKKLTEKFCQSFGYEHSDGYRDINMEPFEYDIKIKCDGLILEQYTCEFVKYCEKHDEFGGCDSPSRRKLLCDDGTNQIEVK